MYKIEYHKKAIKDIDKLKQNNLVKKAKALIEVIKNNPFQNPPLMKNYYGDLKDLYSRRINIQHRLIYEVLEKEQTVRILSMWSHYE